MAVNNVNNKIMNFSGGGPLKCLKIIVYCLRKKLSLQIIVYIQLIDYQINNKKRVNNVNNVLFIRKVLIINELY